MTALVLHYWPALLLSFAIGLFTAWHSWGRRAAVELIPFDPDGAWHAPADTVPSPADPVASVGVASPVPVAPANDIGHRPTMAEPAGAGEADVLGPVIAASRPEEDGANIAAASSAGEAPDADFVVMPAAPEVETVLPPDDLTRIKGIGPELELLLRRQGVQRFEDIAGWLPEDIERIDGSLGPFKGSIIRDEWIAQARLLARGDMALFDQRYGHL
ncbi:hypothetical protein SLG_02260 [Sphingobium sp. SYK-6]|uniref:hypothetical protein n=1 Tax=Sphingobium sp. (strain NBRC 103272 / SYK-6) TaxID=627192 RepID=UPI0002276C46|nr:hypothetical protein [Sphingobium sp. SYK-6]BAK64901.1 hypothetical protein SLG_02260 [Sphingobium sp. SYK-6]